ncbi:MAG: alpha/beta fold hydrolase [Archangium sp.]|nr:alpha/beta fold hydrolase [Archangium sp.]
MSRWLVAALALGTLGCSLLRSSREPLRASMLVEGRRDCVVVLLPGLGDAPERFDQHGFAEALERSPAPCDLMVVDSHFGYYRDAVLPERLAAEVLSPLRARYLRTWLVGVSLGGYGAALTASARPDLVDGVVLISPFLGVPRRVRPFVEQVEASGGLDRYQGPFAALSAPRRHFVEAEPLWAWLSSRARAEPGPRLVLAFGTEDGFSWKHRVLGDGLEARDVVELRGRHSWETFAALWREVVQASPWRS